jgi:hypothetical protein
MKMKVNGSNFIDGLCSIFKLDVTKVHNITINIQQDDVVRIDVSTVMDVQEGDEFLSLMKKKYELVETDSVPEITKV